VDTSGLEAPYSFGVLVTSCQTTIQYCDPEYYIMNLHCNENHVYFEIFKAVSININFQVVARVALNNHFQVLQKFHPKQCGCGSEIKVR
jgi:hypothetical protein